MYVITAHQRYGQTDRRTSSDPMTATLLKHVAVKIIELTYELYLRLATQRVQNCNVTSINYDE